MQGMAQWNQTSITHTKEKAEMAHIKTAQNGEQKVALSTPEWIRVGLDRGFLQMDPRVAEHGRSLAKSAGINPEKATYTTLKKAMQTPEIMEKLADNMEKAPVKTAQYQVPRNIDQQVGVDQGGYGLGTAALAGGAGLAAAPLLTQGGRAAYKNLAKSTGQPLANMGAKLVLAPGVAGSIPNLAPGVAGSIPNAAMNFGNIARGVGGFAARAALPALALGGGFLGSNYLINKGKEWMRGDSSPSPLFMQDQKAQQKAMRAIDKFNMLSPALKGMSSSIDEHIDAVGAAVTDTMQSMQTGAPTAMSPQFASQEEERAAQFAALQQQIAAAQAANQKNILGPKIPAPTGLGAASLTGMTSTLASK